MRDLWLFQMSNEQHRVALLQGQPRRAGPFFRLTVLSVARIERLHNVPSALSNEQMAPGSHGLHSVNRPWGNSE